MRWGGEKKADVVPHSSHYPALGGHYKQIVVAPRPHTISCRDSQPLSASMYGYINIRIHIFSSFTSISSPILIHIRRSAPCLIFTSPSMIGSGSDSAVEWRVGQSTQIIVGYTGREILEIIYCLLRTNIHGERGWWGC